MKTALIEGVRMVERELKAFSVSPSCPTCDQELEMSPDHLFLPSDPPKAYLTCPKCKKAYCLPQELWPHIEYRREG